MTGDLLDGPGIHPRCDAAGYESLQGGMTMIGLFLGSGDRFRCQL